MASASGSWHVDSANLAVSPQRNTIASISIVSPLTTNAPVIQGNSSHVVSDTSTPSAPIPTPEIGAHKTQSYTTPSLDCGSTHTEGTISCTPDGAQEVTDVRLGPHRDGRIRNPIPSKLKGKTDGLKGNFSVMSLDVGRNQATERDAAAKRTSESTQMQAKLAETDHYVSIHRNRNVNPHRVRRSHPASRSEVPPSKSITSQPLTGTETKAQQARLLTLLRSLSPQAVVDQLCKAVAFFGGIPDAPPPADGKFPESAEANGPGSLFVGWITEIFPDLEHPRPETQQLSPLTAEKRSRGRPKGSKSSRAKRDRGLTTKSSSLVQEGARFDSTNAQQAPRDDSWIDVEESLVEVSDSRIQGNGLTSALDTSTPSQNPTTVAQVVQNPTVPRVSQYVSDAMPGASRSVRRRGRPKGSKNRPKDAEAAAVAQPSAVPLVPLTAGHTESHQHRATAIEKEPGRKRTGPGRPKGSKNKPKAMRALQVAAPTQPSDDAVPPSQRSSQASPPQPIPSGSRAFGPPHVAESASSNSQVTQQCKGYAVSDSSQRGAAPSVKESTISSAKRKRQSPMVPTDMEARNVSGEDLIFGHSATAAPKSTSRSQNSSEGMRASQQAIATQHGRSNEPPIKRARKSKDPTQSVRQTQRNAQGSAGPSTASVVQSEPSAISPQSNATARIRTPAEGLEAHYERFTSAQNRADTNEGQQGIRQVPTMHQPATTVPAAGTQPPSTTPVEGLEAHYAAMHNRQQPRNVPVAPNPSPKPSNAFQAPEITLTAQPLANPLSSKTYYSQSAALSSSYGQKQQAYAGRARQSQQEGASISSPQFTPQNNQESPVVPSGRGSFARRRTPSASPMDTNHYHTPGVANQPTGFNGHHNASAHKSHAPPQPPFQTFADTTFMNMSGLNTTPIQGPRSAGPGPYVMNSKGTQQSGDGPGGFTTPGMNMDAFDVPTSKAGIGRGLVNSGTGIPGAGQHQWSR